HDEVERATQVPRREAERDTDEEPDAHRDEADRERDTAAQRMRESMSRPRSSVPRRWPALGGSSASVGLTLIGSYGAMKGANTASASQVSTSAPPRIMRGLRRAK